jgi:mRNA interferase MazF
VICDVWDVVVVPFPFTDRPSSKRRPAVVFSNRSFNQNGYTVLAMITSAEHQPWPGDTQLGDLPAAGLHVPCTVRLKLFTLDNRLLSRRIGQLSTIDRKNLTRNIEKHLF